MTPPRPITPPPPEVAAARAALVRERPYLAAAAAALTPISVPGIGSLAVDARWRLYYDPAAIQSWPTPLLAGVIYHEILHLLRRHHRRAEQVGVTTDNPGSAQRWNLATDAAINHDLAREGVSLPDGAVYPATLGLPAGQTAEAYYAALAAQGHDGGPGQDGQDGGPGQGGQGQEGGQGQAAPAAGQCGSCATGVPASWELPPDTPGAEGLTDAEAEVVRRQVAEAVRQAGTAPGHLRDWAAAEIAPPRIPWQRMLAAIVRGTLGVGATDYTYSRPSRRGQALGSPVILPVLRRPTPTVAVVVDTSGSVSDGELAAAAGEVWAVTQAAGGQVRLVSCDTVVHADRLVRRPADIVDTLRLGGGGTDLRVGLAHVASTGHRPDVVVLITDGWTPWPTTHPLPGRPVVVVTNDRPGPDWARTIRMEED